jgi:hypothetical protein
MNTTRCTQERVKEIVVPKFRTEVTQQEGQGVKPFSAVLLELQKGGVHRDLSEKLAELVKAVADTQKKGSLTLRIDVTPNKDEATYLLAATVTAKAPQHTSRPSLFFALDDGSLTRKDPRQMDLQQLHAVAGDLSSTTISDAEEASRQ